MSSSIIIIKHIELSHENVINHHNHNHRCRINITIGYHTSIKHTKLQCFQSLIITGNSNLQPYVHKSVHERCYHIMINEYEASPWSITNTRQLSHWLFDACWIAWLILSSHNMRCVITENGIVRYEVDTRIGGCCARCLMWFGFDYWS